MLDDYEPAVTFEVATSIPSETLDESRIKETDDRSKDWPHEMASTSKSRKSLPESSQGIEAKRNVDQQRNCTACQEHFFESDLASCPCGHGYCGDCLSSLFQASITDDGLFPPRCCKQPIFSSQIQVFLSSELINQYEAKKLELDTPNRTYCSNPVCSIFIRPEYIAKERAACPECTTVTCTTCKGASHIGDCPNDTDLQLLLDLAKENGWQRCYNCHRVVELDIGCNHMTCPCGSQFCYVCAARWKTCPCEQWDEQMLVARANDVVDRNPVHNLRIREEQIAVAVENLRARHNCNHTEWRWIRGPHNCEECRYLLRNYIFECPQCSIRVCNRCRRNRI